MSRFTDNVNIAPLPNNNKRITTAPLIWYISDLLEGPYIEVPTHFTFDGASVPMLFGMIFQRVEPKSISPACLHDRLYTDGRRTTRLKADQIFLEALQACGVGFLKRRCMYLGVRAGGRIYRHKLI